ncbi:MAG: hypothetical protein ACRCXT_00730 [Paraclostridium sp.]
MTLEEALQKIEELQNQLITSTSTVEQLTTERDDYINKFNESNETINSLQESNIKKQNTISELLLKTPFGTESKKEDSKGDEEVESFDSILGRL